MKITVLISILLLIVSSVYSKFSWFSNNNDVELESDKGIQKNFKLTEIRPKSSSRPTATKGRKFTTNPKTKHSSSPKSKSTLTPESTKTQSFKSSTKGSRIRKGSISSATKSSRSTSTS